MRWISKPTLIFNLLAKDHTPNSLCPTGYECNDHICDMVFMCVTGYTCNNVHECDDQNSCSIYDSQDCSFVSCNIFSCSTDHTCNGSDGFWCAGQYTCSAACCTDFVGDCTQTTSQIT